MANSGRRFVPVQLNGRYSINRWVGLADSSPVFHGLVLGSAAGTGPMVLIGTGASGTHWLAQLVKICPNINKNSPPTISTPETLKSHPLGTGPSYVHHYTTPRS